jgi:hypothetical protein
MDETDLTTARARRATAEASRDQYQGLWEQVCAERDTLLAERAQAVPVLAAAVAWRGSLGHPFEVEATMVLVKEIDIWRMSGVAEPCPHCGGELYDRVVWDPATARPRCPDCGADAQRAAREDIAKAPPPQTEGGADGI